MVAMELADGTMAPHVPQLDRIRRRQEHRLAGIAEGDIHDVVLAGGTHGLSAGLGELRGAFLTETAGPGAKTQRSLTTRHRTNIYHQSVLMHFLLSRMSHILM